MGNCKWTLSWIRNFISRLWNPCIELISKDIVQLPTFKDIKTQTKGIIKEFKYSHFLKGLLNEFQKTETESNHSHGTYVWPVATSWGSKTES